jgi:hypothetical protein
MAMATANRVARQEERSIRAVDLGEIAVQVSLTVWVVSRSSGRPGASPRSVALAGRAQPRPGERYSSLKKPGASFSQGPAADTGFRSINLAQKPDKEMLKSSSARLGHMPIHSLNARG